MFEKILRVTFLVLKGVKNPNINYISNFSSLYENQYEHRDKLHFRNKLEVCQ